MIKLVTLLALIVVVYTLVVIEEDDQPEDLSQPTSVTQTADTASTSADRSVWPTYSHSQFGFSLRYPAGVLVGTPSSGTVRLSRPPLTITVQSQPLLPQDTVNTLAEQDIEAKIAEQGDRFELVGPLAPIAIGGRTGVTYSSKEQDQKITYFYVPQDSRYLLITNETSDPQAQGLIPLSDQIIFSLEILAE